MYDMITVVDPLAPFYDISSLTYLHYFYVVIRWPHYLYADSYPSVRKPWACFGHILSRLLKPCKAY